MHDHHVAKSLAQTMEILRRLGVWSVKLLADWGHITQGSILGPLLFIIYINDISTISNVMEFALFAEDTNLFLQE